MSQVKDQAVQAVQEELKRMHELLKSAKARDRKWVKERIAALQDKLLSSTEVSKGA